MIDSRAAAVFAETMNAATQTCAKGLNAFVSEQLDKAMDESNQLKKSIASLEESLANERLINRIRDNDKMTKFYTGLKSWNLLLTIYKVLLPDVVSWITLSDHMKQEPSSNPRIKGQPLPPLEQFLLVLMRLWLNLPEQDLAYRFHISMSTVSKYIERWKDVMHVRLPGNFVNGKLNVKGIY